jgi:EAL domain-containing protein (putative c-di-GMP-specific phosphodiesterase class I)
MLKSPPPGTPLLPMARSLGMAAIAEGVKTQGQLEFLRCHGCLQIQAYLMGKPMLAQEIEGVLCARTK